MKIPTRQAQKNGPITFLISNSADWLHLSVSNIQKILLNDE
jgi:hypothetical protein